MCILERFWLVASWIFQDDSQTTEGADFKHFTVCNSLKDKSENIKMGMFLFWNRKTKKQKVHGFRHANPCLNILVQVL